MNSSTSPSVLDKGVLSSQELRDFLPVMWWLARLYIAGSLVALGLLEVKDQLLVPLWAALPLPAGFWLLYRGARAVASRSARAAHLMTVLSASFLTILYVPMLREPFGTMAIFLQTIHIVELLFLATPRLALAWYGFVVSALLIVRSLQYHLGATEQAGLLPLDSGIVAMAGLLSVMTGVLGGVWILTHFLRRMRSRSEQAERELDRAYRDLRALERTRTDFLSSVTHDLKTPLITIRGYLDLSLRSGELRPGIEQGLRVARRNTNRLQRLIEELLTAADPQSANVRLQIEPVDVHEVIQEEVASFENQASSRGVAIVHCRDEEVRVLADPLRLGQVLTNLIDNALRYSPEGGIVEVGARSYTSDSVSVWVGDQGPGIPDEIIQRLFETHYLRAAGDRALRGSGLGLTICQRFVTAMGGRISVESNAGAGTRFQIVLPTPAEDVRSHEEKPRRRRALVLDDESDVLELVQVHLHAAGYDPVLLQNGTAAYEMAMQEDFDILLLDVNVPGLTGVEVSRRLRDAGRPGRILLFSALIRDDAERLLDEARADGFLPKPFNVDQIERVLKSTESAGAGVRV